MISSATTTATLRRTQLSFSVDQVPTRDEMLLKSYVRLLDHRTHQHWVGVEQGGDLRISGDVVTPVAGAESGLLLRIATADQSRVVHRLVLPLRADVLEAELNRAGDAILLSRHVGVANAGRPVAPAPATPVTPAAPAEESFRLRRWPAATLLNSSQRVTLATLLSARVYTLPMLQTQSGMPAELCAEFVRELRESGLLHISGVVAPTQQPQPQAVAAAARTAAPQQAGLLARIRARFGLQPAWAR